ncbi:unnamed protein product, partial [Ixodes pacificus]
LSRRRCRRHYDRSSAGRAAPVLVGGASPADPFCRPCSGRGEPAPPPRVCQFPLGVTGVPTWDVPSLSHHVTSTKRRACSVAAVFERAVETAKVLDSDFGRSKRCLRNRAARRCRVQQVWVVGVRGVERAWPGASNARSSVAHVETRLPSFPVTPVRFPRHSSLHHRGGIGLKKS